MAGYIPPSIGWVRRQVEEYESSGGTHGTTLLDTGIPCVLVIHRGNRTGAIRKIPLIRVKVGEAYVLIGSMGGQPKDPVWVHNLRAHPEVKIRDATERYTMRVREVTEPVEREASWQAGLAVFAPYADYKAKTERTIPVFLAEPV